MSEKENLAVSAFQALSRLANAGRGDDWNKFAELVTRNNRTLQQNAFNIFSKCIQKWAADGEMGIYDLRNEDTVNQCAEIVDKVENFGYTRYF